MRVVSSLVAVWAISLGYIYYSYGQQPDNAPNQRVRSIFQSIINVSFSFAAILRQKVSNEAGVWWLRNGVPLPHRGANENTTETTFELKSGDHSFIVHSWR